MLFEVTFFNYYLLLRSRELKKKNLIRKNVGIEVAFFHFFLLSDVRGMMELFYFIQLHASNFFPQKNLAPRYSVVFESFH